MNLRPSGLWCDLAYDAAGHLFWAYSVPGAVVVEKNFTPAWQQPVPTGFLLFTRIGIDRDGAVYACGAGHDDHGYMVSSAGVRDFGLAVGNNPVAFGLVNGDLCVWIVYALGAPVRYRIVRVRDGAVIRDNQPGIATSQGIRDITPDGSIVWGDPTYGPLVVDGHTFNQYQQTANYLVGQRNHPDGIGALVGESYWTPLTTPNALLGVHGAWHNGTLAVCGYFQGAHAGTFTPPYPVDAVPSPVPPPPVIVLPPPPSQPPPPTPEPTPVTFTIPQALDKLTDVKARLLASGQDLSGPCGAFKIVKQFAYEQRGLSAGLLSKPSGNNCEGFSVDWILFPDGSGSDVLGDAGGANIPQWDVGPPDPTMVSRYRAVTEDPGFLSGAPSPVTPPPQPPADPNEADLTARVGALEAALAHLLASQETLEGRVNALPAPVALPDLSTFARKGDKVTVSAKLPFFGSVVAHGSIDT